MMYLEINKDVFALAQSAAKYASEVLRQAIVLHGEARLMAATGASQLPLLSALATQAVDWGRVTIFHQDEYIGLDSNHPASFATYIQKRLVDQVHPKAFFPVQGIGDIHAAMCELSKQVAERPMDLAFIGLGENAHIAFNDPPADFVTQEAFKIVDLEARCKYQQVREGWFETIADVPRQAITLTVSHILRSRAIVSFVPYAVKADAVAKVLSQPETSEVPGTVLKGHPEWHLYLDSDSARQVVRL